MSNVPAFVLPSKWILCIQVDEYTSELLSVTRHFYGWADTEGKERGGFI